MRAAAIEETKRAKRNEEFVTSKHIKRVGKLKSTSSVLGSDGGKPEKPKLYIRSVTPIVDNMTVGDVSFLALVDSGSGKSFLRADIFHKIRYQLKAFSQHVPVDL